MQKLAATIFLSAVFAGAACAADAPPKVPPKPIPGAQPAQPVKGDQADDFPKQWGTLKSHPEITASDDEEKKALDDAIAADKKAEEALATLVQKKNNKSIQTKELLKKAGQGAAGEFADNCEYATDLYDMATLYRDKAQNLLSIYPAVKSKVSKLPKPPAQANPNDNDVRLTRFLEQQYRNICAAALEQSRQAYLTAERSKTGLCKVERKPVDCSR